MGKILDKAKELFGRAKDKMNDMLEEAKKNRESFKENTDNVLNPGLKSAGNLLGGLARLGGEKVKGISNKAEAIRTGAADFMQHLKNLKDWVINTLVSMARKVFEGMKKENRLLVQETEKAEKKAEGMRSKESGSINKENIKTKAKEVPMKGKEALSQMASHSVKDINSIAASAAPKIADKAKTR